MSAGGRRPGRSWTRSRRSSWSSTWPCMVRGGFVEQRLLAQVQPDELLGVGAADGTDQDHHDRGDRADAAAGDLDLLQGRREVHRPGDRMSYEAIAVLMFSTFMLLLLTGQRVFGAIGFVAAAFALALWGEGAVEMPFASTHHAAQLVSDADAAHVRLHGLHAVRVGHRERPVPDVPRLDRADARRAGGRHDPAHGGDLGDERPERGGHGDRGHDRAAGVAEARLRQDHGDRRDPGRQLARHHDPAERRARALRHDRPAAGGPAVAGRRWAGAADGGAVHPVHRDPLPAAAAPRTAAAARGTAADHLG